MTVPPACRGRITGLLVHTCEIIVAHGPSKRVSEDQDCLYICSLTHAHRTYDWHVQYRLYLSKKSLELAMIEFAKMKEGPISIMTMQSFGNTDKGEWR